MLFTVIYLMYCCYSGSTASEVDGSWGAVWSQVHCEKWCVRLRSFFNWFYFISTQTSVICNYTNVFFWFSTRELRFCSLLFSTEFFL